MKERRIASDLVGWVVPGIRRNPEPYSDSSVVDETRSANYVVFIFEKTLTSRSKLKETPLAEQQGKTSPHSTNSTENHTNERYVYSPEDGAPCTRCKRTRGVGPAKRTIVTFFGWRHQRAPPAPASRCVDSGIGGERRPKLRRAGHRTREGGGQFSETRTAFHIPLRWNAAAIAPPPLDRPGQRLANIRRRGRKQRSPRPG
ncbi:hypothetical protein GWI33_001941 [Rhynchophorus ferrugineus]|uniref:Uncharacterized protein n=1 Tax=Rhynchophorus ferrugineus TaxID=354439 RepID=A0A834MGM8_RHYFE|nr:hypothetical protein GWI33_001941 [Rhynchophorus ferrugineus]